MNLFIHLTSRSQPPSAPLMWSLPLLLSLYLSEKGEVPPEYQLTLTPQVTAGLVTSSPTEARQDSPVRGTDPQADNRVRIKSRPSCWVIHMKTELQTC